MVRSITFVSNALLKIQEQNPSFKSCVLEGDEDTTFSQKFKDKFQSILENISHMKNKKPVYIYIAMKPQGEAHWTSAVLLLKSHKPKLFILDSIRTFSNSALSELASFMHQYGGHTFLSCSGVQYDNSSCADFTIDFLVQLYQLHDIFAHLILLRRENQCIEEQYVTRIAPKNLPWQLIRNAQYLPDIEAYLKENPDCEELKQYINHHIETRIVGKKGKQSQVNIGIEASTAQFKLS
jgi:hypothetical protein